MLENPRNATIDPSLEMATSRTGKGVCREVSVPVSHVGVVVDQATCANR